MSLGKRGCMMSVKASNLWGYTFKRLNETVCGGNIIIDEKGRSAATYETFAIDPDMTE